MWVGSSAADAGGEILGASTPPGTAQTASRFGGWRIFQARLSRSEGGSKTPPYLRVGLFSVFVARPGYSARNAMIGSTLDARRAGNQHAATEASVTAPTAASNAPGLMLSNP